MIVQQDFRKQRHKRQFVGDKIGLTAAPPCPPPRGAWGARKCAVVFPTIHLQDLILVLKNVLM